MVVLFIIQSSELRTLLADSGCILEGSELARRCSLVFPPHSRPGAISGCKKGGGRRRQTKSQTISGVEAEIVSYCATVTLLGI